MLDLDDLTLCGAVLMPEPMRAPVDGIDVQVRAARAAGCTGTEPEGPPLSECMARRALPGQGVVDLDALLGLFDEIGARPRVAPEVFDTRLLERGADAMADAIARATRRVLGRTSG